MSVIAISSPITHADGQEPAPAAQALRAQLESLREVIASLSPNSYRAAPSRVSGSIGGHVRHTLDHVRALVSQWEAGEISYDSRLRGTPVEMNPWAAIEEIDRLTLELEDLHGRRLDAPVRLESITNSEGATINLQTTVGRELAFVLQHTIHHAAVLAVLLEQIGAAVPAGFGYAPSTLAKT